MKKSSKLQKKLDKVMKKIKDAGLEVKKGKVVGFKYFMQLSLTAEFYSHYDGHTNDAIMNDDIDFIDLPDEVFQDMQTMDTISFNVIPQFDEDDDYGEVELKVMYKGNEIGTLGLEYSSEFTKSWKEYKTLPFKKVSNKKWLLDGLDLEFDDDQEEHTWGEFEITKQKEYL